MTHRLLRDSPPSEEFPFGTQWKKSAAQTNTLISWTFFSGESEQRILCNWTCRSPTSTLIQSVVSGNANPSPLTTAVGYLHSSFWTGLFGKKSDYSEAQCSYQRKDFYHEGPSRKSASNKYAANASCLCQRWPHGHYLWNRVTFISCSHHIDGNK